MTRVAAIDCGTNSIRLLVADIEGDRLVDVTREMRVVRLGAGVDRTGRFAADALARTLAAVDDYAVAVRASGATAVRMVATSATRDAANRDDFVRGVHDRLGVEPDVVSGAEEAALSFAGATRELRDRGAFPAPYLVCDIGGGSTEFVLGDDTRPQAARSVDVGCVRLTERHLRTDPPTAAEIDAARADAEQAVRRAAETVPMGEAQTLLGLAGSVTTVVGLVLDLPTYDADRIHHARVTAEAVREVTGRLLAMPRRDRAALAVMHPGRVDVIGAGALVLDTVLRVGGFESVVASEHDILDGIAWSLADRSARERTA